MFDSKLMIRLVIFSRAKQIAKWVLGFAIYCGVIFYFMDDLRFIVKDYNLMSFSYFIHLAAFGIGVAWVHYKEDQERAQAQDEFYQHMVKKIIAELSSQGDNFSERHLNTIQALRYMRMDFEKAKMIGLCNAIDDECERLKQFYLKNKSEKKAS